MNDNKKKYALIGKSLSHSFSQKYFTDKFLREEISAAYHNVEITEKSELKSLLAMDFDGFNVTMPYKEVIMDYLDELSPAAREVGAVNTIQVKEGKLIGHNTDVFGFQQMIKPFFESQHERALIIGTGGASKAVAYVLENLGVSVIYLSRQPKRANEFGYDDLNENMITFNGIIVNTTPVGMFPAVDSFIELPFEALTTRHLVVDLIYNPEETVFLRKAKEQGAKTINGLTMLHQQAEQAWKIWNM
jgi:shikimate dehydrogenase